MLQTNNTGVCLQCLGHTEFAPAHGVYFSCLHCLGSRLLCQELSEASPGLYALPRSKPLRFRYLGTSQRHRLCWACVCAFPGPSSSGDQVLGESSHPQVGGASYHLPCPSRSVFCVYKGRAFSGVPCVSSGELISGCDPPSGCRPSRIPRNLG